MLSDSTYRNQDIELKIVNYEVVITDFIRLYQEDCLLNLGPDIIPC